MGEDLKVVVANKTKDQFFTMDKLAEALQFEPFADLMEFIFDHEDDMIEQIGKYIESNKGNLDINTVEMLPAIPYPLRNVFCVGKNYKDHVEEMGANAELPKSPVYFSKAAFISSGPEDEISTYSQGDHFADYEAELIVVMGKEACNAEKEDVEDLIFGYAAGNDFTIRDTQMERGQWYFGKSYDGHFAMGSWIAHKSMFDFPIEVDVKCTVNGEVRQNANTRLFIFDIPTVISDITTGITLYPGDMIMTGTPSGVGMAMKKQLKPGDKVVTEVTGIETFENTMVE
jgi:2-keto-4-pentenoate hydratase/2-oxohepta-3-ene-1,7-dioic acid hydratase in catechol pathway